MRVGKIGSQKTAYLTLDELAANPRLARRLPPDLARRFCALPLAEDRGRITVAMANPDDAAARDAVLSALGQTSTVVQADPTAIDALLAEIWGSEACQPLRVQVCAFPQPASDKVWNYAQALGDMLRGCVSRLSTAREMDALIEKGGGPGDSLIVFEKPDHPWLRRWHSRAPGHTPSSRPDGAPFAVLVAPQPRWPLKSILLVLWGQEMDQAAMDWVVRLARPSAAAVTVLAVVPPVPAMYQGLSRMEQGIAAVLTTDTALGRQMHQIARHLVECRIEATLRLRQGPPDWQICREIAQGDHDLVALAAGPRQWWRRWLVGDLVGPLLCKVDRPLLIAEPTIA